MADRTKIEWSQATWNPVTGCTKVSPGCDHCYAETFAERWRGTPGHHFEQGFDVVLRPERLDQPLRWKKPRRVFVNSMSDLFHEAIPDEYIAKVFAVMALAPQHTFQVLTKRHGRMRSLLNNAYFWQELVARSAAALDMHDARTGWRLGVHPPVLRNVWLGVSVENQKWADIRIPALLETPAAVRWISAEPLLGPVDLAGYLPRSADTGWYPVECRHAYDGCPICDRVLTPIDAVCWVVAGGESGPGARPMHPDWARSLRDQCAAVSVPFFFKQHGEWAPIGPLYDQHDGDEDADEARMDAVGWEVEERKTVVQLESTGHIAEGHQPTDPRTWLMVRRGKRATGREMDGRTWDEYPQVAPA